MKTQSEGLIISEALCLGIFDTILYLLLFFLNPDLSFKTPFVSTHLHWCVDYCHSLVLKGRVCNRWTLWSRPTVAASAG